LRHRASRRKVREVRYMTGIRKVRRVENWSTADSTTMQCM